MEVSAGGERLLAKVDADTRIREGDAMHFTLDPAHCMLVGA